MVSFLLPNIGKTVATDTTLADAAKLVQEQKYAEAVSVYDAIIESGAGPTVPEARYRKGLCLKAQKQYPAAVACWEDLLKAGFANPWQEDALLEMAKTYAFDLNQAEAALKLYERFFKKFPASKRLMEARYQECGVYYRQGKPEQTKTLFERFLKEYPDSYLTAEVRKMIVLCDDKLASTRKSPEPKQKPTVIPRSSESPIEDPTAKLSQALNKAEELFNAGQYEKALKAYQDIRRNFSSSAKDELSLFRIGRCYANLGQDDKALAAWGEIVMKSRGKPGSEYADDSLLAMLKLYLEKLGEPEKALECYQTLTRTMPESELLPEAEHCLGLIYFYQGKMNEARVIFEKEREITPQDTNAPPDGLTRLIEFCKGERRYVPDYTETAQGQRANTQIRRGDMYFTAKEYEKAKTAYEQAVRLAPGAKAAAYALMQAGRCWNQLGQFQKALHCYEPFLKQYQNSIWADDALLRAGVIYVGPLDNDKAGVKMFETILAGYPDGDQADTAAMHLATLVYWEQKWKKALELHELFLGKYPDSKYLRFVAEVRIPAIKEQLGLNEQKRGETREGRTR
ncbi:MAG: tetratricopeptide repeat protein [Verrucomicrobia bacterium]|nr:tetratricopeptide repeat protein [Verrucomicrobiota bacterium]